jgi:hypothetical protein
MEERERGKPGGDRNGEQRKGMPPVEDKEAPGRRKTEEKGE